MSAPDESRVRGSLSITLICHVFPPEHAPAGVMVDELAADLSAHGHRVTVITGWPSHPAGMLYPGWQSSWRRVEENAAGVRIVRCGHSLHARQGVFWRLWYYLTFAISTLLNGLLSGRADAVLCLSTPLFGSWTAWLLARLKGARFVYVVFDLHPESAANAGLIRRGLPFQVARAVDTALCRLSDSIVTLSRGLQQQIAARGVAADTVEVVPFWLDGSKVSPGPRENAWRQAHDLPPDVTIALYAGTIGLISGAEILVETARMLSHRPDILLLCVGEGPAKDRLAALSQSLNLPNLRFLPFQPASVLNEMQATADIGLVTLLPEADKTSVPSKILGYLAAARPVIASVAADSFTAEMVLQGECGCVTPCGDAGALATAIQELADDRKQRVAMGFRGREYFDRHFERKTCVEAYERLLARVSP